MRTNELKPYLNKKLAVKTVKLNEGLLANDFVADTLLVFSDAVSNIRSTVKEEMGQWFWNGWNMAKYTEVEQQLLKYYYPLAPAMQSHEQKAHCLSTAFGMPFNLKRGHDGQARKQQEYFLKEGEFYEYGPAVPNEAIYFEPPLLVEIGPIATPDLTDWVPGGRIRWFFEKVFLPMLLQTPTHIEIRLLAEECTDKTEFDEGHSYWELNFYPSEEEKKTS